MRASPYIITSNASGTAFATSVAQPGNANNDISVWTGAANLYPTSIYFSDVQVPVINPSTVSLEQAFASASVTANAAYQYFILGESSRSFAISAELV
jgi:hypothetical protein